MIAKVLVLVIVHKIDVTTRSHTRIDDTEEFARPISWLTFLEGVLCLSEDRLVFVQHVKVSGGMQYSVLQRGFMDAWEASVCQDLMPNPLICSNMVQTKTRLTTWM